MMGEADFLQLIKKQCEHTGYNNWGSDCATLPAPFDDLYISTDQFIEGTHFDLSFMSLESIGWKATAAALSDLAAAACKPIGIMASISWPNESDCLIDGLFSAIAHCCKTYDTQWMGGDISRHKSQHFIDITVIGKSTYPWQQRAPSAGELLVTTGPLGLAKAGLETAKKEQESLLSKKFLYPEPKIKIAQLITQKFKPSSMTDISDGLYRELNSFTHKHSLGCEVRLSSKNFSQELLNFTNNDVDKACDYVLSGGDDYELLFTCQAELKEQVEAEGFIPVGYVTTAKSSFQLDKKSLHPDPSLGWDSFRYP